MTDSASGVPLVIFALEPLSYAQAIGEATARLRPGVEVRVVAPKDLVSEMRRRLPALVFSGEPKPDGWNGATRWAQYRPYADPEVVRVDGRDERFPGLDLEDLLGLVDRLAVGSRRGQGRTPPG